MIVICLYFSLVYSFGLANLIDLSSEGEVLCGRFNLEVSSLCDKRSSEARICIVVIKDTTTGFNHIA